MSGHDDRRAIAIAELYLRERLRPPSGVCIDPHVTITGSALRVVHCQHHVRGVPLFLQSSSIRNDLERGEVTEIGDYILDPVDVDVVPTLGVTEAVGIA